MTFFEFHKVRFSETVKIIFIPFEDNRNYYLLDKFRFNLRINHIETLYTKINDVDSKCIVQKTVLHSTDSKKLIEKNIT